MNIYSSFYRPLPPAGIADRKAYIIGGGIAGMAAAAFLVDDAGMPGENITIFEQKPLMGGSMDGIERDGVFLNRGERELEPYMETLWYLFSKIPSLDSPGRSVLDETVDVNRAKPIHSEARIWQNQGHIWDGVHDFRMSPALQMAIQQFLEHPESDFDDLSIVDYFGADSEFFDSALWWCFHSMLAFKPYHSALEMKRYMNRFSMDIRVDYLEGILHTKRNEYDSMIKPLAAWLAGKGVKAVTEFSASDLDLDDACTTVQAIHGRHHGEDVVIDVNPRDLVFVTNGSMTTNSRFGDNNTVAETVVDTTDLGLFDLWIKLANKSDKFGRPEKFLGQIDKTKWISFFLTITDYPEFFQRMERLTGSTAGTGGAITIKDSAWEISFALYDNDYFPNQGNRDVLWGDGLFGERIGDHVKKPMAECTGEEILTEFLYHLGMLDIRDEFLAHTYISTTMMPYITSQFMPRTGTDRPRNVPEGSVNLGFIGQYVEIPGDVVFTVETSVRTALEAVYKLAGVDKDIIEVYPARYDIRYIKERFKRFAGIDGRLRAYDLLKMNPFRLPRLAKELLDFVNEIPPYYVMYPGRDKTVAQKTSVLSPQAPIDVD